MNFPLKDIEFHIDDAYIEQAEALFRGQALLSMDELERHLWVFKILDKQIYEAEIQISPSKVKATSCECAHFKKEKVCAHIVVALLAIRKHINEVNEKREEKKKQQQARSSTPKLTTNKILENASFEEIKDFIRQYSKRNRNFSLALKARFASIVPTADSEGKYSHLLDMTLKAVSREGSKINASGAKQLINLIAQFIRHAEEAELRNDYAEVTAILKAVFDKSGNLLSRMEKEKTPFLQLLNDHLVLLRRLLKQDIAPALKEEIWSFMLSKIGHGAYRKYGLTNAIIKTLLPLSKELQSTDELLEFIDQQLEERNQKDEEQVQLILAKFSILEDTKQYDQATQLLNEHLGQPKILLMVLDQTIKAGKLEVAQQLAEKSLKDKKLEVFHSPVRDYLLEIALKKKKNAKVVQLARLQYLENYEPLYYEMLKKQKSWKKIMPDLLTELKRLPYKIPVRDAIAYILHDNKDYEGLLEYIRDIKSFDLLMKYDKVLFKSREEAIANLYQSLLDDYLGNHLGRQSSQKVRQIIAHLFSVKKEKLARQFVEMFRRDYPERHSLMDELEIFH